MKSISVFAAALLFAASFSAFAQDGVAAFDDQYTTSWDSVLTVASPGLLANDRAGAGDTLRAFLVAQPQVGRLTLAEDGSFTFEPVANAQGPVTFLYGIENQHGDTSYANGTITVTPGNKPPLAITDYYTVRVPDRLIVPAPGLLGNDIDLDGDTLSVELVDGPDLGTFQLNEDGGFWFEPSPADSGETQIRYRAVDARGGSAEGVAYFTVVSPSAPLAEPDHYEVFVGHRLVMDVLANDQDADGNVLHIVSMSPVSPGYGFVSGGQVIEYICYQEARVTFSYTVSDGVHQSTTTVTIDVTDGDLPPVAVDDLVTVHLGSSVRFNPMANDYDPNEGTVLRMQWAGSPTMGTLVADGEDWIYTPNADAVPGVETLSYGIWDGFNAAYATVTIEIHGPNQAPEVGDDYLEVSVGRIVNSFPVVANDSDPDGDDLTISRYSTNGASYLSLFPSPDRKGFSCQVWRPGTYTVTYWVTDGHLESQGQFVIFAPGPTENIARDDAYTVVQGQSITLNTFANDVYFEHSRFTPPEHTSNVPGALVYTNGDFQYLAYSPFVGDTSFTYTLPGGSTATVTITVLPAE